MVRPALDSYLFSPLFSDAEVAEQFSDTQLVRAMLEIESALAIVEGRLGVIPTEAADQIVDVASRMDVDFDRLRSGVEKSGVPVIDLVRRYAASDAVDRALGATCRTSSTGEVLQSDCLEVLESMLERHPESAQLCRKHLNLWQAEHIPNRRCRSHLA
jgi:hypothetical protein